MSRVGNAPNEAMHNLIPTGDASTVVLRDLFVTPLRNAASDADQPFDDPVSRGDGDAPMVLTSFPDTGRKYPHVIVQRGNASAESLDRQSHVYDNEYTIEITAHSKSSTQANKLIDGVIHWVGDQELWLHSQGFMDISIGSTVPVSWDDTAKVTSLQTTVDGRINTSTEI